MSNAELSNEVLVNLIKEGWDPDGKYMLQLWDQNQGLIRKIINHYQKYDSMDDLMQEAFIGLQKAVEQYEPMKEIPFFNHAAIWINNTLALYARRNGKYIRLPYTVYSNLENGCRYRLDGAAVHFTPGNEVVNGEIKKRARNVVFELRELMVNRQIKSLDEVSALIVGKVITGFRMEEKESIVYRQYVLTVTDPETGKETTVLFTGL